MYDAKIRSVVREDSLFLREGILTRSADGTLEVRRMLLEGGTGGDAVVGIAPGGVVFVTAGAKRIYSFSFLRLTTGIITTSTNKSNMATP